MDRKNQEEIDLSQFVEVSYMYETPEMGLFESRTLIQGLELASIESLNKEIKEQYGILVFEDDDEYDEDKVWTGEQITKLVGRGALEDILICTEGAYHWDDFDFEYKIAGALNKQKTNRVKCLEIPEDKAMLIDGEITVIQARTYEIEQEKVQIINKEINIEMFTIRLLSGKAVTIPNSPDVYKVYEADRVWIDYQT